MSAETFSLHLAQRKQSTCHNAELEGRVSIGASKIRRQTEPVRWANGTRNRWSRSTHPNATTIPPFSWSMTFLHPPHRASISPRDVTDDMASWFTPLTD